MSTALAPIAPSLQSLVAIVRDSVPSLHTKRAYGAALTSFFAWQAGNGATFCRSAIHAYRSHLEAQGKGGSSINQSISALKKLALEAAERSWIDPVTAAGIASVRGVKRLGRRAGLWLNREQVEQLLRLPDTSTLRGKRDRALLWLLFGCALRRHEAASVEVSQLQMREGRPCFPDLIGKANRVGTVPVRWDTYRDIKAWLDAAGITEGTILRPIDKAGNLRGKTMSAGGIWYIVCQYGERLGVAIRPHDLRRTAARLMRKDGAPIEQVQGTLRHSSPETTARYVNAGVDLEMPACDYMRLRLEA
jgi:integrase/recombinase XerD